MSILLVLGLVIVPVLLAAWLWHALRPVDRAEVERFVDRSGLEITPTNGPMVTAALARRRFWRVVGVLTALGLWLLWAVAGLLRQGSFTVQLTVLLLALTGYYLGSAVAELRTATAPPPDGVREASLTPRAEVAYVGAWAWRWTLALGATGALGVGLALLVRADAWTAWFGAAAALVAVATRALTRFVLDRPQPVSPADVVAADDALRSRGLHVLSGTAVAIEGWLASVAACGVLLAALPSAWTVPLVVALGVVVPLAAVVVGRRLGGQESPHRATAGAAA